VDQLKLLGVALGLASLAGLNLYLTVFVTGLSIHYQWITLGAAYQSLEILGHPAVIIIAGIMYVLEFFADKIPWVDTAWDAVHTIIRPIGGALLAIQTLGQPSPAFTVIVGLLAGSTSLITHTAKSTTRLASHASPEPFSNIALSLTEDAAVLGGLALIYYNPLLALSVFALALAVFLYFAPKILRTMRARIWLTFKKLNLPANWNKAQELPYALPPPLVPVFDHENVLKETIAWAASCLSARGRGIPANLFGALVATNEEPRKIFFVARKNRRPFAQTIDLSGATVEHESKFLLESVSMLTGGKGAKYSFVFPRSDAILVEKIVKDLRERISAPIWPLDSSHREPALAEEAAETATSRAI
jgi:hypothetical protein